VTWVWIAGGLLCILLLWRLLGANVLGRNRRRGDLEHWVRSLLLIVEDGGLLTVEDQSSGIRFQLVRQSGSADSALLELQVPRASWSESALAQLERVLASHDLDADCPVTGEDSTDLVAKVRIPVPSIWEEWSGAKGARAAQLVLDALSVPRDTRLHLDLVGPRINRLPARRKFIREHGLPDDNL